MTREVKNGNKQVNKTTDEREESNYRRADEAIAGHFNEQIVEHRAAQKTAIVRRCHVTTAARRAHTHTHTHVRACVRGIRGDICRTSRQLAARRVADHSPVKKLPTNAQSRPAAPHTALSLRTYS